MYDNKVSMKKEHFIETTGKKNVDFYSERLLRCCLELYWWQNRIRISICLFFFFLVRKSCKQNRNKKKNFLSNLFIWL